MLLPVTYCSMYWKYVVLLEACSSMALGVFDGILVSVIRLSVISPTGDMLMCFSSSQVISCTFKRMCWSYFLVAAVFVTHFTHFSTCCFFVIRSFSHKDICHWVSVSNLVANGFAVLAFFKELTSPPSDGLFHNFAVVHKVLVTPCVFPMQIWYVLSMYLPTNVIRPFTFIALCFFDFSCLINFLEVTFRDLLYFTVCSVCW